MCFGQKVKTQQQQNKMPSMKKNAETGD